MQFRFNPRPLFAFLLVGAMGGLLHPACNNASETAAAKDGTGNSAIKSIPLSTDSTARVDDFSFIDGCLESNKAKMGEPTAFAYCKCIMAEIKLKYGNTDSLTVARLQKNTAEIARILKACK